VPGQCLFGRCLEEIRFDRIAITTVDKENRTLRVAYVAGAELHGRETGKTVPLAGTATEEAPLDGHVFTETELTEELPEAIFDQHPDDLSVALEVLEGDTRSEQSGHGSPPTSNSEGV